MKADAISFFNSVTPHPLPFLPLPAFGPLDAVVSLKRLTGHLSSLYHILYYHDHIHISAPVMSGISSSLIFQLSFHLFSHSIGFICLHPGLRCYLYAIHNPTILSFNLLPSLYILPRLLTFTVVIFQIPLHSRSKPVLRFCVSYHLNVLSFCSSPFLSFCLIWTGPQLGASASEEGAKSLGRWSTAREGSW